MKTILYVYIMGQFFPSSKTVSSKLVSGVTVTPTGNPIVATSPTEKPVTTVAPTRLDSVTLDNSGKLTVTDASGKVTEIQIPTNVTKKKINLTPIFEVYGDSISDTVNAGGRQQTWAMIVARTLGKTLIGSGISGNQSWQMMARIYNTRSQTSNNSAIIFIGTNDINGQVGLIETNRDSILEQVTANIFTSMLYCSLPVANKFNARNSTKTGTWVNTAIPGGGNTNIGSNTATVGSSISQEVTGRYVSFTCTFANPQNTPNFSSATFNYSITNAVLDVDNTIGTFTNNLGIWAGSISGYSQISGGGYLIRTYLFDTGKEGNHTITITSAGGLLYVDWFAGWESNISGNPCLCLGLPSWNYTRVVNVPANDVKRTTFNEILKDMCNTLTKTFYLPVTYVDLGATPGGNNAGDGLHLNFIGQKYVSGRVLDVINGV